MLQSQQSLFVLWPVAFGVVDFFDEIGGAVHLIPAYRREKVFSHCDVFLQVEVLLEHSCYVVHNAKDGALLFHCKVVPFETLVRCSKRKQGMHFQIFAPLGHGASNQTTLSEAN